MGILWMLAGGQPRRLDVTVKMLRQYFNRDGHSFRDHLEALFALGRVHLLARDKRRGRFLIYVLHPEFELPFDRRDGRQLQLPLAWEQGCDVDEYIRQHPDDLTAGTGADRLPSGDQARSPAQSPADGSKSSDTGEAQSPTDLSRSGREPQTARSDEARRAFGRGIFPEPVTGKSPQGQPTCGEIPAANSRQEKSSRGNPRHAGNSPRGIPRDESPTGEMGCVTGKSPSPPVDGGREISHGVFPATDALYTPRASRVAPASLNDSSKEESLLNGLMNNESKCSMLNESESLVRPAREAGPDREAEALAGIIADRRAVLFGRQATPPPIAGDVLDAVNAVGRQFATQAQKERLVTEIRLLTNDPKTGTWLYGFFADLIVVHGQSQRVDASQIYQKAASLLQEFRDLREMQRRNGYKPYALGARLNKVVHAICDAHRIATPQKRRIARQAMSAGKEAS